MTKKDAAKACRWFQRNVGLVGWNLVLSVTDCPDLCARMRTIEEVADSFGLSSTDLRQHILTLWVNPENNKDAPGEDNDWLATLMHELLHGAFGETGITAGEMQEHLLDTISHVLAERYRSWQQA